ncbi:hypothetical protein LZ31DRAFT_169130 [Colletotrichum somersetense]|nr:hypothetical protein LZ31DRAFT_169130 [Colletotrichum somersetense]
MCSSVTQHYNLCTRIFSSPFQTLACTVLSYKALGGEGFSVPVSSFDCSISRISHPLSPSRSRVNDREAGMVLTSCPSIFFSSCTPGTPLAQSPYTKKKVRSNPCPQFISLSPSFFRARLEGTSSALPVATPELNTPSLLNIKQKDTMSTCVAPPRPSFRLLRCKCYHPPTHFRPQK